jgi:DNA repair exonuclease SbcCD nuclease subunit
MTSENSFRFVHCADLHLDSPFRGISSTDPELAAILRNATFQAFEKVVDVAIEEEADLILISGDIYDQGDGSLRAQLGFRDILQKASDRGIRSFIVHGNHDPLESWKSGITFPAGVHRFGPEVEKVPFSRNGKVLAEIYGISYKRAEQYSNLASLFRASGEHQIFRIGLLHCNLGGSSTGHGNYSPCTMDDLERSGMDYWALGHIHKPSILRDSSPSVVYSGNIQGRHIGEKGKRGCYLVEVSGTRVTSIEFHETSVILWSEEVLDISDMSSMEDLVDGIRDLCDLQRKNAGGKPSVMRLVLRGGSEVVNLLQSPELYRELVELIGEDEKRKLDQVWIESIRNEGTLPFELQTLRSGNGLLADFLELCDQVRKDPALFASMVEDEKAFRLVKDFLGDIRDPSFIKNIMDDVEKRGITELIGEEGQ